MKFIGIDIGTSSICGVVYDSSSKETISITKPNNSNLTTSQTWKKEQDPTIIITTVIKLIEELRTQHPDIAGIGISGQMHGVLYINSKAAPLVLFIYGRTVEENNYTKIKKVMLRFYLNKRGIHFLQDLD